MVNDNGTLLGEVDITKIRHVIFRTELYKRFVVGQLMTQPAALLSVNDPMAQVMKVFEKTGAENLPVIDVDSRLVGYISRTRLYNTYRRYVADFSAE